MRIVITGHEGQVARSLWERGTAAGHDIVLIGRPELDLAGDENEIVRALTDAKPEAIISAAAYTAVDKAEDEPEEADSINRRGAGAVARAARQVRVPLLHLSTDYVFDGAKPGPYSEEDPTGPTGVYGATKLAGEHAILAETNDVAILRTAWVYSPFGRNFVKTMLALASDRSEVRVVADQFGNPTCALDIADALLTAAANLVKSDSATLRGLFHLASPDEASWADLAEHVFDVSARLGGPSAKVIRIATTDFPTRAARPADSRLDCSKLAREHGITLPSWRHSSEQVVTRLLGTSSVKGS